MPRNTSSRQTGRRVVPHVGDLFTDRLPESVAYALSLDAHRAYMDSDVDEPAARNLLVFYGVGGIGKTTLSERLERWGSGDLAPSDPWGPAPATAVAATCRVDLHRTQGRMDLLTTLVAIRRAFGSVRSRWMGFDLAFAAYWSAINPGEPLPGTGTTDSSVADGISDSIAEVLSEVGIPGAGIATRSVRAVVRAARTKAMRRNVLSRYAGFEELLDRCSDLPSPDDPHPELIGDLAGLLDLDLAQWDDGPHAPLIVVFIDTFERLVADPRRVDEIALNELIWRMPNVLFVATGRGLIDWYDEKRVNLYVSGRSAWPGLVPGAATEPRQHLVGRLAPEDRRRIIQRARELYEIDISETIEEQLANASDGLPQYLDLALSMALNRKQSSSPPITVADVSGSLRELVLRVLEDVPDDEQKALRAASMFPFFDIDVVAKAAAVDDGCARRALARPMIDHRGSPNYPYSMHDAIRHAIRGSDHSVPNGWSDTDWRKAGDRGLEAIREDYEQAAAGADAVRSLETLTLAIVLVSDQELTVTPVEAKHYVDWLSKAIVYGPSITGLRASLPTEPHTEMGRGIVDFVVSKTAEVTPHEGAELLTRIFESDHPLRLPAGRHRGYVLRNASMYDEALAAFNELVAVAPTPLNCYQRVLTLTSARRFAEALDDCAELTAKRAESIRVTCAISHGDAEGYVARQERLLEDLRSSRRQREAIDKAGNIVRWNALLNGAVNADDLARVRLDALKASHLTALRDEYVARLFSDPAATMADPDEFAWIDRIDRSRNIGDIGFRSAWARIAMAMYTDDDADLARLAEEVCNRGHPRSRLWISVESVLDSMGYQITIPPTQWLEPYPVVQARWRGIFDAWLARVKG